jgi:hypothetical protein
LEVTVWLTDPVFSQHTVWPWVIVALDGENWLASDAPIVAEAPIPLQPELLVELEQAASARNPNPATRKVRDRMPSSSEGKS